MYDLDVKSMYNIPNVFYNNRLETWKILVCRFWILQSRIYLLEIRSNFENELQYRGGTLRKEGSDE
jgi:hypothetical protein